MSIAFGLVLVGRPDVGAISLAVIYRILSVAFGIMPMMILLEIGTAESRVRSLIFELAVIGDVRVSSHCASGSEQTC